MISTREELKNVIELEKKGYSRKSLIRRLIIPGLSEPPVRTLRATIPENGSHIFR